MKRTVTLFIRILLGLVLLVLILLFTIPVLFKDKIRTKVEQTINESVNASVKFEGYKLTFFKNFPNLSFSLNNVSVVGVDKFSSDTLAGFQSFDLVFNLASIFRKSGYEVKSIIVNKAVINGIVLQDGSVNWDIMKGDQKAAAVSVSKAPSPSVAPAPVKEEVPSEGMKILLKKVAVLNSVINYRDDSSSMSAYLKDVNFNLTGDMTMSQTNLKMQLNVGALDFIIEGVKYLNNSVIDAGINMQADLNKMKFTFGDNYCNLNDLHLKFAGSVTMVGDNIDTDLSFETPETSFKTLLSLIPSFYMQDYNDLKADGEFSLTGTAKGIYSDADSTLPNISVTLNVNNGTVSYPDLPEKISSINVVSSLFFDGEVTDRSVVDVQKFHMELAGNPFDMTFHLEKPVSDPDFSASAKGKIDLSALSKAIPMDSVTMSGIIEMSMEMAGRLSMIEKEQYESFKASGSMSVSNMEISVIGYPDIKISKAGFSFTPAYAAMSDAQMMIGSKSDFILNGRLSNYIPYLFRDATIQGNLTLKSELVDMSEIMSKMTSGTEVTESVKTAESPAIAKADSVTLQEKVPVEDTTALGAIAIPRNIDFDFNAAIKEFRYDNIDAGNLKGHIVIHDGILSLRDAGMDLLGGSLSMNADYDTRDTLKPTMRADFNMREVGIKDAFNTFNSVRKLAPAAKGLDGKINAKLTYRSLLGSDMMPLVSTINGYGKIQSDQVTLIESATFDRMKELLKVGDKYSNTFKDINISFRITDGRIYVSPFDVRTGNLKMNISGDQGLDQTINYIVKTEFPRSDLGGAVNSFIDNLSDQAARFGLAFKPSDVIKVNLKVTGTFSKPVVMPYFGSGTSSSSAGTAEKSQAKQVIDNTVGNAKEKARSEAEAQGDKLIKEAEQKGEQLKGEAAKAAEKIRDEAAAQAKKLNDEAASKGPLAKMAAKKAGDALVENADQKAEELVRQADEQAEKLVSDAKAKKDALLKKIGSE
jgi:hypothetical protein